MKIKIIIVVSIILVSILLLFVFTPQGRLCILYTMNYFKYHQFLIQKPNIIKNDGIQPDIKKIDLGYCVLAIDSTDIKKIAIRKPNDILIIVTNMYSLRFLPTSNFNIIDDEIDLSYLESKPVEKIVVKERLDKMTQDPYEYHLNINSTLPINIFSFSILAFFDFKKAININFNMEEKGLSPQKAKNTWFYGDGSIKLIFNTGENPNPTIPLLALFDYNSYTQCQIIPYIKTEYKDEFIKMLPRLFQKLNSEYDVNKIKDIANKYYIPFEIILKDNSTSDIEL